MPALKRTTILAEPDLLDRLDRHARRTRSTKTALIAAALEAYLSAHEAATPLAFIRRSRSSGLGGAPMGACRSTPAGSPSARPERGVGPTGAA